MSFRAVKEELSHYFQRKISLTIIVIFIVLIGLLARLFYLQVIGYSSFLELSDTNRIRISKVLAERGFILDRNGKILVKNAPTYELVITKEDVVDLDGLLDNISKQVYLDVASTKEIIRKSYFYQPTVISRGLTFEQTAYFLEHSADFIGLSIDLRSMREYYDGVSLSQLIGYLGEVTSADIDLDSSNQSRYGETIGKNGIEKLYEDNLRGFDGARQVQVDSFGRLTKILVTKDPVPGSNLYLTIDYELQKFISDSLVGRRGSVVVMDIEDFSVLSLVSSPSYDLRFFSPFILKADWNNLLTNPDKPLLNRAIAGAYPPGSIYKVLMALTGLMEGVITEDTKFKCTGNYILNRNFNYHCWKRSGHGEINLQRALAVSCDVYFYNLGRLLDIDIMQKYSNLFSLGRLTGIDIPNEKKGFFPSREWKKKRKNEVWFPGETIITSIGQGYTITTPMQVAVMMGSIFNGGKVYKPRVVDRIISNIDNKTTVLTPEELDSIEIPEKFVKIITAGLVDSVYKAGGTSRRAAISYRTKDIAGKTSTAQVVSLKKTEGMKDSEIPELWRDHSWFTAVFPADNPRYVIVVMVENGGSGGKTSAPLGGQIVKKMKELGYVKKN